MSDPIESIEITRRFFDAIGKMKEQKRIRGLNTFVMRYGLNYWNVCFIRDNDKRIKQEWLTYLVRDYGVSATWLLTGKGKVFTKSIISPPSFKNSSYKKKTPDNDTDKA